MIFTEQLKAASYECQVVKYIDGDTLDMNINLGFGIYTVARIRLIDIDAPELNNSGKYSEERKQGEVALVSLKEWFYNAPSIVWVKADSKGIYGRWLGEIWKELGQQSLNDYLISLGYFNGGWSVTAQNTLLEEWYNSENFKRYGKMNMLGNESQSLKES